VLFAGASWGQQLELLPLHPQQLVKVIGKDPVQVLM
jgi:hypothetical protein